MPLREPLHRFAHGGPHLRRERPHGAAQLDGLRDDVVGRPGVDLRHGDDGALDRVDDARHDVLKPADDLRGGCDRVDRLVRRRSVTALAADLDLEHVGGGGVRPAQDTDLAERVEREEMRAHDHVDALHDAGLDELARAARPELLGVLEDEADLAVQLVAALVQSVQRRKQHRRVAVVAARVHDAGVLGGELEAGLLLDRKRVDVGA